MTNRTYPGFTDASGSMVDYGDIFDFDGLGQAPTHVLVEDGTMRTVTPEMEAKVHGILMEMIGRVPPSSIKAGDQIPNVHLSPILPRLVEPPSDPSALFDSALGAMPAVRERSHFVVFTDGEPDPEATARINSLRR